MGGAGIRAVLEEQLAELRTGGAGVGVVEAAVLIEAGWLPLADEGWLVTAGPETARQRLMERNGLSPEQAESRSSWQHQLP